MANRNSAVLTKLPDSLAVSSILLMGTTFFTNLTFFVWFCDARCFRTADKPPLLSSLHNAQ